MEYVMFLLGIMIILVSLFLTYNAKKDDGDYYLETEILAEIREVKDSLKDSKYDIVEDDFQDLLNSKLNNSMVKEEVKMIKEISERIIDNIGSVEERIEKIERKIGIRFSLKKEKEDSELTKENKDYNKIKDLVEEGMTLQEVARELDMGMREVELIWKLNSRREI